MNLSAFTSFTFSETVENTVANIEHYFNWFYMSRKCNLCGHQLSRTQVYELMSAAHGYKSYVSFKSTNDVASLSTLNIDFNIAVAAVMERMNAILGVSNKLFAQMLTGSMYQAIKINQDYEFKVEASNLICFYIGNYGDNDISGVPKLSHIYMMALNNIGLSLGLYDKSIQLNRKIYKHFVTDSPSPLKDMLRIRSVIEDESYTVNLDIKLPNDKWVNLSNNSIGQEMNTCVLGLSSHRNKVSIPKDAIVMVRDLLENSAELSEIMPQLDKSKLKVESIYCNGLDRISDFLKNNLSYSFTSASGEEGIYGSVVDAHSIELIDTYTICLELSNNEITVAMEIAGYLPTMIELSERGLSIKPIYKQCADLIAKISVLSNDGSNVIPDFWKEVDCLDECFMNNLYGQLGPNIRKAKYLYACAMDNIMSVSNQALT